MTWPLGRGGGHGHAWRPSLAHGGLTWEKGPCWICWINICQTHTSCTGMSNHIHAQTWQVKLRDCYSYVYTPSDWVWFMPLCVIVCACVYVCARAFECVCTCPCMYVCTHWLSCVCVHVCVGPRVCVNFLSSLSSRCRKVDLACLSSHADVGRGHQNKHTHAQTGANEYLIERGREAQTKDRWMPASPATVPPSIPLHHQAALPNSTQMQLRQNTHSKLDHPHLLQCLLLHWYLFSLISPFASYLSISPPLAPSTSLLLWYTSRQTSTLFFLFLTAPVIPDAAC